MFTMLREAFGAQFPGASGIIHLMAVRGLLIFYLKRPGISHLAHEQISAAINKVNQVLADEYEVSNPKEEEAAPYDLFVYYRDYISRNWAWLNRLANLE